MNAKTKSKSLAKAPLALNVKVQKKGIVYKLPFGRSMKGSWKKRLCVVKDGYLMYYKAPSGKLGDMTKFDIHPKGVLPLGRTTIQTVEPKTKPPPGYVAFMVSHPDFTKKKGTGANLIAACPANELAEWFQVMEDASKVTYENAREGDKRITELRETGSKKLKEKKSWTKKAKEDAAKAKVLITQRSVAEMSLAELKKTEQQKALDMEETRQRQQLALQEQAKMEDALKKVQSKREGLEAERQGLETKASTARMEADEVTKKLQQSRSKAQMALEGAEKAAQQLADEEKKLRLASQKRDNEVEKAIKERDRLLAQIAKEKQDRMDMEEQLHVAAASLHRLDQMLRRKKLGDLGINVDINNIKNMLDNNSEGVGSSAANSEVAERKNSLDALRVGSGDERRQRKREEAMQRKRAKRLAQQNAIIGDSQLARKKETTSGGSGESKEGRDGKKGVDRLDGRDRFDTDEIKAMEVKSSTTTSDGEEVRSGRGRILGYLTTVLISHLDFSVVFSFDFRRATTVTTVGRRKRKWTKN